MLQFPQRTIEQLKQQSTPLPPPSIIPVHSKQSVPQQQQTNQKRQRHIHHHQPLQQQDTMEFIESNNVSNISMPPRARLLELKTNAEFAAEDFNHTIKTWVNMASLLVKQVHLFVCFTDEASSYLSLISDGFIVDLLLRADGSGLASSILLQPSLLASFLSLSDYAHMYRTCTTNTTHSHHTDTQPMSMKEKACDTYLLYNYIPSHMYSYRAM